MMAFELQRRSLANNWGVRSVAAHPGVAVTELVERGPGLESEFARQWAKDREVYHLSLIHISGMPLRLAVHSLRT